MSNRYSQSDLAYGIDALEPHYSSEMLELHYGKHHAGYVKKANKTVDDLEQARQDGDLSHVAALEASLAFNVCGHRLHELFWRSMSPDGGGEPSAAVGQRFERDFGGVSAFREHFAEAALSVRGSGWAVLGYESQSDRLLVAQISNHEDGWLYGLTPVLALDMWEHAFYLQYRNEKKKWVNAFWDLVDWGPIQSLLADRS